MPPTATPVQETVAPSRRPHAGALSTSALRHESDERLVFLTRAGSERSFAEIMRRYERQLHYYCAQIVGHVRAEDAVQQAFLQAFVALRDGERHEIALRPWLYRIARNCSIDLLRKQPFEHDQLDPEFDGMPQPPGVLEQKEELNRVIAAIQALPEGQRRALTLRELEGRSYGEISAELGHTSSGVRQLIFRARTALRNLGAIVLPVYSIRSRILGGPAMTPADPHQVAAAASLSGPTGAGPLQAAGSIFAATLTLLAGGATVTRGEGVSARPAPLTMIAPLSQGSTPLEPLAAAAQPGARATGVALRVAMRGGVGGTPPAPAQFGSSLPVLTPGPAALPITTTPPVLPAPAAPAAVSSDPPATPSGTAGPSPGASSGSSTAAVSAQSTSSATTTQAPRPTGTTGTSGPTAVRPPILKPQAPKPPTRPTPPSVASPKSPKQPKPPKAPASPKKPALPVPPKTPPPTAT